ncbi:MAG: two-CW domain-containing protein [Thermodesulfobacteriota bacterium]
MAQLLGISVKAVRSYEQGWRHIPTHVERQMLFLTALKDNILETHPYCWDIMKCPPERRRNCPAWEFNAGALCWFINGTICEGEAHDNWDEKIRICRTCQAFPEKLQIQNKGRKGSRNHHL